MRTVNTILLSFLMFSFVITSCKKEQVTESKLEPFSGILQTDDQCVGIGGDTTDFLPRPTRLSQFPFTPTNYSLINACPNPVNGDTTFIKFQIPVPDSVCLQVFATPNTPPIVTLMSQRLATGLFQVQWGFNGPNGTYRVLMTTAKGFRSYGDIEFR